MLLGHFIGTNSSVAGFSGVLIVPFLTVLSLIFLRRKRGNVATLIVTAAFFMSGLSLVLIEDQSVAPTRLKRMFDEQILALGEPVELTGVIRGPVDRKSVV